LWRDTLTFQQRCSANEAELLDGALMNFGRYVVTLALIAGACRPAAHPDSSRAQQEVTDRLEDATRLLRSVGKKVPSSVATSTVCGVIMPAVVRGGLILGARHGHGFAVCEVDDGVSAPAPVTLSGGTAGLQVGIETVDLLMLITNDEGRSALMRGRFELGVDASVAAGPVGTGQERATDTNFRAPVLTYTRSSGLFAGAVVSGAVVEQDQEATLALYGKHVDLRRILAGQVKTPPLAKDFTEAIEAAILAASGR
jgi:lipid-binding SYLF domain-containing protein